MPLPSVYPIRNRHCFRFMLLLTCALADPCMTGSFSSSSSQLKHPVPAVTLRSLLRSLFIPLSVFIGLPQKFDWVCYKILWEKNKLLSQPNIFFHNTYYGPKSSYCGLVSFLIVPSRDYNIGVESGRTDMKICL